jgi:ABC-2 type transport system ATP-binding protein
VGELLTSAKYQPMLQLKEFKKTYGSSTVLKIDGLNVEPGIFWIKGVNGSGKSTLLKAIAGVISFDGDILLDKNISLKKQPVAYRRLVNFAEAEPIFPEFLTGMEMIRLFTEAKEAPSQQEKYFVESMGMRDYIKEPLGTYSSGMLKKLSLVLAFLGNPKIILLDEPLITLDLESLKVLYQWIEEKFSLDKVSFFLSSHQPLEPGKLNIKGELLVDQHTVKFIA